MALFLLSRDLSLMVSRKQRKIDDLKRREAYKEPRISILIVTEGSKTEPIYFSSLRNRLQLSTIEIEVVGAGAAPISVVDRAIELRSERERIAKRSPTKIEYEIVYCVVDVEVPKCDSLDEAVNKANGNNIEVILSNPCFEFWYILHFKKTSAPFNSSQKVKSSLRKFYKNYQDNM